MLRNPAKKYDDTQRDKYGFTELDRAKDDIIRSEEWDREVIDNEIEAEERLAIKATMFLEKEGIKTATSEELKTNIRNKVQTFFAEENVRNMIEDAENLARSKLEETIAQQKTVAANKAEKIKYIEEWLSGVVQAPEIYLAGSGRKPEPKTKEPSGR